jgi:GWxTD domain-containing protein
MKLLEIWVTTPAAKALGWTLFYSLFEGAIVAVVLAAILWAVRPARARYAAACLAMVAMLGGFGITFERVLAQQRIEPRALRGVLVIPPQRDNLASARDAHRGFWLSAADILPWLAPFWMTGVLVFQLRSFASWMAARRLCKTGICQTPAEWQHRLDRLRARLRLSRPIVLLESGLAEVPVVVGYVRPTILIPAGLLAGLPPGQMEAILLHELAHIRRCDYLWNLLQAFAEGLLFYHPAVWWISGVIRAERENCCDDLVVAVHGDAHEYAAALATLETARCAIPAIVPAAARGSLVKRIRRLLFPEEFPRAGVAPVFTAAALAVTVILGLSAWQTTPAPLPQQATPWTAWLSEDVTYIITPEERLAFQNLRTDEERQHCIEQFWERRNPKPGSATNAAKNEHYRRIQYANRKFTTAEMPGWKTDRGRIYITFGPPDEIESHPGGGVRSTYPYEDWLYDHIDGVGDNVIMEFVDPAGSGDYRMTMDPNVKEAPSGLQKQRPLTGASVVTPGDGTAKVSVSMERYQGHPIIVSGRLVSADGRMAGLIRDLVKPPVTGQRLYTLQVQPGDYQLHLAVQDLTTNTVYNETLTFTSR